MPAWSRWCVGGARLQIAGFWTAVGTAIIVGIVSWAASSLIGSSGRFERFPPASH